MWKYLLPILLFFTVPAHAQYVPAHHHRMCRPEVIYDQRYELWRYGQWYYGSAVWNRHRGVYWNSPYYYRPHKGTPIHIRSYRYIRPEDRTVTPVRRPYPGVPVRR